MENNEIVIESKKLHSGYLHGLITNGGSFIFSKFPFGINIVGDGSPYVTVQLYTVPQGQMIKSHTPPKIPKKVVIKPPKDNFDLEESESIVM